MITDYTSLQTSVQKFLKRADLAALVPDFIALAENHFNRNIYTTQRRDSFSLTPATNLVSLPSDCARIVRAYYGGRLLPFFENDANSAYANGNPHSIEFGYQLNAGKMALSVPSLGQILRVDYYTVIEPLSDTNTSNWLIEDASDVYLYGALHEAAVYVRDDARMQLWLQKRDAAITDLTDDDAMLKYPEQPLVIRRY